MKISLIVAHGKNRELGLNNQLLWHIPEDLKSFKRLTTGHHVLMGRKTFESIIGFLGKPLPNRTSIILSRSKVYSEFNHDEVMVFSDFEEAIYEAEVSGETDVFIIGGAEIYNTFIDRADTLFISEVDYEGEADVFLTEIDYSKWKLIGMNPHTETTKKDGSYVPAWELKIYNRVA